MGKKIVKRALDKGDKEKIKSFLKKDYGLNPVEIVPFLKSYNCHQYILKTKESKKYLLKIYPRVPLKSRKNILKFVRFLDSQKKGSLKSNIQEIVPDIQGNLSSLSFNNLIIIYKFIVGKNIKRLDKKSLNFMGNFLSKLHDLNPRTHSYIKKESLSEISMKEIKRTFWRISKIDDSQIRSLKIFKELILNEKKFIFNLLYILKKEERYIINKKDKRVICHTDLHSKNILKNSKSHFIIDWEHLEMALPERDLIWFLKGKKLEKEFLNFYLRRGKQPQIDQRAIRFYLLKRFLLEFLFFSKKIPIKGINSYEVREVTSFLNRQIQNIKKHINPQLEYF